MCVKCCNFAFRATDVFTDAFTQNPHRFIRVTPGSISGVLIMPNHPHNNDISSLCPVSDTCRKCCNLCVGKSWVLGNTEPQKQAVNRKAWVIGQVIVCQQAKFPITLILTIVVGVRPWNIQSSMVLRVDELGTSSKFGMCVESCKKVRGGIMT